MSVTLEVSQLEHSIEASAEQPAKVAKDNVSNYAWQSAILLVRAASFSACADCHAFFLSLGEFASELSHLFQLGRGDHAVTLGHTADGDNALVLPLAVRTG